MVMMVMVARRGAAGIRFMFVCFRIEPLQNVSLLLLGS